jgi:4'-phosphopantetheinyl transferase
VNGSVDSLTPEILHVWCVRLTQSDDVVRTLKKHLSPDEVLRADRYRRERDRIRYIIAHGALREMLADYTGQSPHDVSFGYTAAGKPFLIDDRGERPLRFNLSHSGDWAAVGVALSTEVGIDVERIDSEVSVEAVAGRFFSRSEFEALRAVPPDQRVAVFFTAWARKEAYVKARGEGILDRLRRFSVSIDPEQPPILLTDSTDAGGVRQWTIYDLDIAPGYAAAIAAEGSAHRIRVMRWTQPL